MLKLQAILTFIYHDRDCSQQSGRMNGDASRSTPHVQLSGALTAPQSVQPSGPLTAPQSAQPSQPPPEGAQLSGPSAAPHGVQPSEVPADLHDMQPHQTLDEMNSRSNLIASLQNRDSLPPALDPVAFTNPVEGKLLAVLFCTFTLS